MVGRWAYDWMYRRGAPWEGGPRSELVQLVRTGRLDPAELPRALDVGCGSGANAIFLAEHGFEVTGIDFSPVALDKARAATPMPLAPRLRWIEGDVTDPEVLGGEMFDLVVDYGTLDDLRGVARGAMAALVTTSTRPGGHFLLWCFYGDKRDLPWISFSGPSRMAPGLQPGEVEARFGADFDIERLPEPRPETPFACFLLTRRGDTRTV